MNVNKTNLSWKNNIQVVCGSCVRISGLGETINIIKLSVGKQSFSSVVTQSNFVICNDYLLQFNH